MARLICFAIGSAATILSFSVQVTVGWMALIISVIGFSLLVYQHRRIRRTLAQFRLWRQIKAEHDARVRLDWTGLAPARDPIPDADHPFENDLDLTGNDSLHQLLDTTVSLEASERLRDRLLRSPPDIETVTRRQTLVRELLPLTYFRDRLTLSARAAVGAKWHWEARQLLGWLEQSPPARRYLRLILGLASLLAVSDLILFLLNQANLLPPFWIVTFLIYATLTLYTARGSSTSFEQISALEDALQVLVAILGQLETYHFNDKPALTELCKTYQSVGRPSSLLRRAALLASATSIQKNVIVWTILNTLLPWDLWIAAELERYHGELAKYVPHWLDVWFELETTSALATFAYLNPTYAFPVLASDIGFRAKHIGHPLIARKVRVCNDFTLEHLGEIALITGSNMSGKSSFLRTLGINLCLANAGAPVCAESLEIGLFRIFTCIRVNDSLREGFSYFYAEVRRLRALLSALETDDSRPVFFLIDEIFRGTNNRERLIGSRSYLQALIGKHGVGVVASHDLELTQLVGPINYHFEDQVIDGKMGFDFRLRPGSSPTTNALKIMRIAGLPVDDPEDVS